MGMKWKDRMKRFLTEALAAGLLLAPAVLPPAGAGEGVLPREVVAGSQQPEADAGGEDGIRLCGDFEVEDDDKKINN